MSYNYLFDIYEFIDRQLRGGAQCADPDQEKRAYAEGCGDALRDFQRFLSTHYESKLPRRLRRMRTNSGEKLNDPV